MPMSAGFGPLSAIDADIPQETLYLIIFYFLKITAKDDTFNECFNDEREILKLKRERKCFLKKIKKLNLEIKILKNEYFTLENLFDSQIISI